MFYIFEQKILIDKLTTEIDSLKNLVNTSQHQFERKIEQLITLEGKMDQILLNNSINKDLDFSLINLESINSLPIAKIFFLLCTIIYI